VSSRLFQEELNMANANAHTQLELYEAMASQIPPVLWVRFRHLSFAEMATQPALASWKTELLEAEAAWHCAVDA
jgi:hypothetical protein